MVPIVINVEIGIKDDTISKLSQIFTTCVGGLAPSRPALPAKPETKAEAPAAKEAPAVEDMPADICDPIDNMTLNTAVKAAQARNAENKEKILKIFESYGIKSSRECAQDKRAALLAELNAL